MIKYIIPVFLFYTWFSFGQIKSGEVTYKVSPPKKVKYVLDTAGIKEPTIKKVFLQRFHTAQKATPLVSYNLKFNQNEAVFQGKEYMQNDNGIDINHIVGLSFATKGVFYTDNDKKMLLHQFEDFNKTWLVKQKTDTISWHITNKEKTIQGYCCIKATAKTHFNDVKSGTVIAWFCPDLPFQFGPVEFGGLPGLILALERNHYYFYAYKINLSEKDQKIKKPTKGKLVTQQEYFKAIKENEANMPR